MKKDTTEKPRARECVCGKVPVLVSVRGGQNVHLPGSGEMSGKPADDVAKA